MARITLEASTVNFLADEMIQSLDLNTLSALVSACGYELDRISVGGTKDTLVRAVISEAQSKQWLPALCQVVIGDPNYGASFIAVCQLVLTEWQARLASIAPQAPHDPKSALLLFNGSPFADRTSQRQDLSHLMNFDGQRVYIVRGEPASGKTHLASFVKHMTEDRADLRHVYLNLADMRAELISARDVMTALARRMALEISGLTSDDMAQEVRLSEKLCDWFVGQTQSFPKQGVKWVVLIDSVNSPHVGPGALDLIDRLIVSAARFDLVNTALVVLAMDAAVAASVARDVKECQLAHLTPSDVRTFVEQLATLLGKHLDPPALDLLEQQVLQGLVPPYGHDGMGRIRDRLRQLPELLV